MAFAVEPGQNSAPIGGVPRTARRSVEYVGEELRGPQGMSCTSARYLNCFPWLLAAILVGACAGPGPKPPEGDRRGPPPFSSLDLDKDGQLTLDEFKSHKIPHGEHAEVFNSIDTNGDGVITEAEYTSHRPPEPPSRPERDE